MVQHARAQVQTWNANKDCQPILEDNIYVVAGYVGGYAGKAVQGTTQLEDAYRSVLETSDPKKTAASVCARTFMRFIAHADVESHGANAILSGTPLVRMTRRVTHFGLSDYRMLETDTVRVKNGVKYRKNPLDWYLEDEKSWRRDAWNVPDDNPTAVKFKRLGRDGTLFHFACICNCPAKNRCGIEHFPNFTGVPTYPTWPITEEWARAMLIIHAPHYLLGASAPWTSVDELRGGCETFVEALTEFIRDDDRAHQSSLTASSRPRIEPKRRPRKR